MRIAIDYTAAIRQGAGIGVYVRNLVAAMLAQDTDNHYSLLTSGHADSEHPFPIAANVHGRNLLLPDRYVNILWYRMRVPVPATLFTGPADIYHGPDFVLPPLSKKVRKAVTIHDLAFLEHPEYAVSSLTDYLKKVVPEAAAAADVIVTVSSEVSRTLQAHFQTPAEKLAVVPLGVQPYFRRITDPILLAATKHKFKLKSPLVLTIGTLEPRKNHQGLIKAFYQAQKRKDGPAMLAIAGGPGWLYAETQQLVRELKIEHKVRFLGRVTAHELVTLYSMADIFAFPSFLEGFGLPPIEAMTCGAPVITSNTSSLPEVVGDAALQVDPHNVDELAHAITRMLQDEQLRDDLRQKGYQRAQLYTWERAAQKMLHIYQQLYAGQQNFADKAELS